MIFDILEQSDLFDIAGCKRQSRLISWLKINHISYLYDTNNCIIVHKKVLEAQLGVQTPEEKPLQHVQLFLEENNA